MNMILFYAKKKNIKKKAGFDGGVLAGEGVERLPSPSRVLTGVRVTRAGNHPVITFFAKWGHI